MSGKYENLAVDNTFKTVNVLQDEIVAEISLRKMTQEELMEDDVQRAISYLTDDQASTVINLHPEWVSGVSYKQGDRRQHKNVLYKCLQNHVSQEDWTPDQAPSLWAKILPGQSGTGIGEWEQPGSANPYMKGDKVMHNEKKWESLIDNNVWEPGVVGTENLWKDITEEVL